MRYTYPNVLDSPELLQKLVTLTVKLLRQAYRYFKLRKAFSKFYHRHCALVKNITSVCIKKHFCNKVYRNQTFTVTYCTKFRKKNVGKCNFSEQFRKLINRYKRIGYCLDIIRQTVCLVINPIIVDGYASLFNCTVAVWASDSKTVSS